MTFHSIFILASDEVGGLYARFCCTKYIPLYVKIPLYVVKFYILRMEFPGSSVSGRMMESPWIFKVSLTSNQINPLQIIIKRMNRVLPLLLEVVL